MIKGYMTSDAFILLFLFFALAVAIVIKQLQKLFSFIPYTPTLFVASILLGKFSSSLGVIGESISTTAEIDPRGILLIFLPPLIFESSFNSDWYVFRKQSVQIFILAFPSVLISALILMFSIKVIIGYDDSYYTYIQAFMFGSILSCTDTVAVLALLKEAGAPKKFSSLIEGESLLNDGTCMILFTISLELCKGGTMNISQIVILFCELTVGAIVLGVIFGIAATELIKLVKNDSILCYNITLVGCYLLYFTAEYVHLGIHISGIMALVAMGLYMAAFGRTKFSSQSRERVHHIWKVFVFVAETVIFILGGVIVGTKSLNNPELIDLIGMKQILCLLGLYCCMFCARFLSIGVFMPKLKHLGYGLNWSEVLALTYGGLRGAVGIAFTLILAANVILPEKFRSICIFNMAGCAFLTLVINAPTCSSFIIKLGLCNKSQTKVKLFNKFMRILATDLSDKMQSLKGNKYLCNANWQKVADQAGIKQLETHIKPLESALPEQTLMGLCRNLLSQHQTDTVDTVVMSEIRNRFGVALKGIFWKKFENNQCSDLALRKLIQCVDLDLDSSDQPLNSWDYLIQEEKSVIFFPLITWLRQFPLIGRYALSQTFNRINSIYELVSTYIEGVRECEEYSHTFPFDKSALNALSLQAAHTRTLAQHYLDYQIRKGYPQIMMRVQTGKISHTLLNYQMEMLEESHQIGTLDERFYFQLKCIIQSNSYKLENQPVKAEELTQEEALNKHPLFRCASPEVYARLSSECTEKIYQKDEPIVRSYEKPKYIYLVARGEIHEEWKLPDKTFHKKTVKVFEIVGLSELYANKPSEIEYSAVANSVSTLYAFPIQLIKEATLTNSQLENILYKEMLPLIVQINKQIVLSHISADTWDRIKDSVQFYRLLRGETRVLRKKNVIIIEGRITVNTDELGPGLYELSEGVAEVHGPAKFYESDESFVDQSARRSSIRVKIERQQYPQKG